MTSDDLLARLDDIAAAPSFGDAARMVEDLRLEVRAEAADYHAPTGDDIFSLADLTAAALPAARAAVKARRPPGVFGFAGIPLVLILQTLLPILLPILLQVLALLFARKPAMLAALTSPGVGDIDPAVRLAVEGESR